MSTQFVPKVVMTLLVRDEIDIIDVWLRYHLAQGFAKIIVTDNASVDGTQELLTEYAERGDIELHHYPHYDKKQHAVVTGMARRAATEYGADWVLNSDADEFWLTASGESVADAVARLPQSESSFPVPVTNMFGPPLEAGFSFADAIYRDERNFEALHRVGLHAHPTHNLIHAGDSGVEVSQGNHFSSLPQTDRLPHDVKIEVLHFPMRSWQQYQRRVRLTGEAYDASDGLTPSPRHHTMRDYRWDSAGLLKMFYAARHPVDSSAEGFTVDTRLADRLAQLGAESDAHPVPLAELPAQLDRFAALGSALLALEDARVADLSKAQRRTDELAASCRAQQTHSQELEEANSRLQTSLAEAQQRLRLYEARQTQTRERIQQLSTDLERAEAQVAAYRDRRSVRLTDTVARTVRRFRRSAG